MQLSKNFLSFPQAFAFGTAVSSFQVEGASGNRKSDWDTFLKENPAIVKPDEVGPEWWLPGKAEEDIDRAFSLGVSVQRFSLEWARIEPEEGKIDKEALKRYRQIFEYLREKGIKPMVTLNHYTLPHWIAEKGSWNNPHIVVAFERYTEVVLSEFGKYATEWLTLNEPGILIEAGYLVPLFPPQKIGISTALSARRNMIKAHRRAYKVIKRIKHDALVSMAFSFRWYLPQDKNNFWVRNYAEIVNFLDSVNYVDAVRDTIDFIGVNFYTGFFLELNFANFLKNLRAPSGAPPLIFGEVKKPGAYISDFYGPIVPDFFLDLLRFLHKKYNMPIYITENGVADRKDQYRPLFLITHLVAVWAAIQEGIKIKEYLVWSIIDNLEWREGYRQEFGLIHVNQVTGERVLRKSGELYAEIIKENGIDLERLIEKYVPGSQREHAEKLISGMLQH
jgi:beta-glucosidase